MPFVAWNSRPNSSWKPFLYGRIVKIKSYTDCLHTIWSAKHERGSLGLYRCENFNANINGKKMGKRSKEKNDQANNNKSNNRKNKMDWIGLTFANPFTFISRTLRWITFYFILSHFYFLLDFNGSIIFWIFGLAFSNYKNLEGDLSQQP